ncbi:hypothetical protein GCM10027594_02790 [Hymenobacter agri]
MCRGGAGCYTSGGWRAEGAATRQLPMATRLVPRWATRRCRNEKAPAACAAGAFRKGMGGDYCTDTLVVSFTPSAVVQVAKYIPLAKG